MQAPVQSVDEGTGLVATPDMADLVAPVRVLLRRRAALTRCYSTPLDEGILRTRHGWRAAEARGSPFVAAGDVALDLGHPTTSSASGVICTSQEGLVSDGRATVLGPELGDAPVGARWPFAQVVLLEIAPGARLDPWTLERTQHLHGRFPGYMARALSGRLWARLSLSAWTSGLSLHALASGLRLAYASALGGVRAVEVVWITARRSDVDAMGLVAARSRAVATRGRLEALGPDVATRGLASDEVQCDDEGCERCEQQPVCESLRDVQQKRGIRG